MMQPTEVYAQVFKR